MKIINCFQYLNENIKKEKNSKTFVCDILLGLNSKEVLLKELANGLNFPDYFGFNWDAFNDCINDLSWINNRDITIIHNDLPKLSSKDMQIYLSILGNSIYRWKEDGKHILSVIFPYYVRGYILEIVKDEEVIFEF